ncbi:MAG: hypothetical protein KH230_25235 [Enterocloster asparagiformis]|nr:hypothetical protein [Enterocloster asparagiformis]
MGLQFSLAESINQLSEIEDTIHSIKAGFQKAEESANGFGNEAAGSAGTLAKGMEDARKEASRVVTSMDRLSDSGDDVRDSARDARREFDRMGNAASENANEARKDLLNASKAAGSFRDRIEDTSESGEKASQTYRQMGAQAGSFGEAAVQSAAKAMKETNSLSKTVKAGLQGAYGFAGKQADQFYKKAKKGFGDVGTAVKHPIQMIKGKLSDALEHAGAKIGKAGDEADKTGDDLKDMGHDGESAGAKIKDAMGSAVKSFFAISAAIEIAKAGFEAVKNLGSAIKNAGVEAERTGAKFEALFSDDSGVAEWAENYSAAVHRSNTEVQGFLASNKSMYQQMGITGDAANDLSKITTSLAYDLGSAFKLDDAEALSVIQDYISGNTKALADYGIQIDDTVLKQTAMAMGLGSSVDELDEAAQAQVRMNALLQNSTGLQQAASKKQEGYANGIKSLKGIWNDFLTSAGEKFAPVFTSLTDSILTAWPQIEPALLGLADMLSNGLAAGMPVIMDLATSALPPLIQTLGELFSAAEPIGGVLLDLATTALPPLAAAVMPLIQTFGSLAQTILPPLSRIIANIAKTVVPPLTEILKSLSENVIAPLMPVVESIADAIMPALAAGLRVISPLLSAISPVLSGIAEVLSKVVGFLAKVVEWAAGGLANILDKIAGVFGGGSSAESSGADVPHNAAGTENFRGGWTHINERGGEMAYLPAGSTIIPADKSEQIINSSRQQNVAVSAPFSPTVTIDIHGNVDQGTMELITDETKRALRELWESWSSEGALNMAIQQGNA